MKIYKETIKFVLKSTDTTIDDLVKWLKGWKVRKHGWFPCQEGHNYHGFSFHEIESWDVGDVAITTRICQGMYLWDFVDMYIHNRKFRKEFLSELERMREEFE